MSALKFEGPPAGKFASPRGHHTEAAKQMEARPGEWAIVGVYAHSGSASAVARQVRSGLISAYAPSGTFEAMARTVDGEARVYARYVGEPDG
jgi:hypothetical protein